MRSRYGYSNVTLSLHFRNDSRRPVLSRKENRPQLRRRIEVRVLEAPDIGDENSDFMDEIGYGFGAVRLVIVCTNRGQMTRRSGNGRIICQLVNLRVGESFLPCAKRKGKKSRQRPTLARASPALPSAMEPLTSVFGMGTGMTTPLWPPAKNRSTCLVPSAWCLAHETLQVGN